MRWLYDLGTRLYHTGIRAAAPFSDKARAWVEGRRHWHDRLRIWRSRRPQQPLIWMHCASLGEFEQGRPVLEALRQEYPHHLIALTFYSPSGYEQRRNWPGADFIDYLPPDGPRNARRWVNDLQPDLAIFVKYEFWYYHLQALQRAGVPTLLIAAHFRPEQVFFRTLGLFFQRMLMGFDHIFTQDEASAALLPRAGVASANITVAGDPRVDRVLAIPGEPFAEEILDAFSAGHRVLVAGSSWPPDEERLIAWARAHRPADVRLLIVPHDISESHIRQLMQQLPADDVVRYTLATARQAARCTFLVVDTIGLLNRLYRYGHIAWIGGGFGTGLHNTLEPAAYGLPVLFGPQYHKFIEAREMVERGGAVAVDTAESVREQLQDWLAPESGRAAGRTNLDYLREQAGSTRLIMQYLRDILQPYRP